MLSPSYDYRSPSSGHSGCFQNSILRHFLLYLTRPNLRICHCDSLLYCYALAKVPQALFKSYAASSAALHHFGREGVLARILLHSCLRTQLLHDDAKHFRTLAMTLPKHALLHFIKHISEHALMKLP